MLRLSVMETAEASGNEAELAAAVRGLLAQFIKMN